MFVKSCIKLFEMLKHRGNEFHLVRPQRNNRIKSKMISFLFLHRNETGFERRDGVERELNFLK